MSNTNHTSQSPDTPNSFDLHYQIECFDAHAHLFRVKLDIQPTTGEKQTLSLPAWIPGSYLIRDFAKHIVEINARDSSGNLIELIPNGLSAWDFQSQLPISVEYIVYAWDLSVRKAHFDQTHAFFNGTSVFLALEEQRDTPVKVTMIANDFTHDAQWKVATGMPALKVNEQGFGDYWASNYRDLVEYPFELGNYHEIQFTACGIPHKMVFTGRLNANTDFERIRSDVQKICETEIEFFGLDAPQNPPMSEYLFQVMLTTSDYGGLEHRNSTALICARDDLAYIGMESNTDGYIQFLELCSHEYFHTWNVKRIQPKAYQDSKLDRPVISEQLWWFEGVTSYYDALFLLKSQIISEVDYLNLLGKQLTRIYMMPGRHKQSVAESSHYTWSKFYQQDEDAPNSIISYYTKGSLIALALDLTLRQQTENRCSLDTVVRYLWNEFGSKNNGVGIGLEEKQIEEICSSLCIENGGQSLKSFFDQVLYGKDDFDLKSLFKPFGYDFILRPAKNPSDTGGNIETAALQKLVESTPSSIGARLQDLPAGGIEITHVWNQQAAYLSGLTKGDQIIAINGIKVRNKSSFEQLLARHQEEQTWECHYFRRDELYQTQLTPRKAPLDRVTIQQTESDSRPSDNLKWLKE